MSFFVSEDEVQRLFQSDRDSLQWQCYQALKHRVEKTQGKIP